MRDREHALLLDCLSPHSHLTAIMEEIGIDIQKEVGSILPPGPLLR